MAATGTGRLLLYIGFFAVCLVVGGGAIHLLRRYLKNTGQAEAEPALTMTQLREMRERGEVSVKEYDALRRIVASQYESQRPAAKPPAE